MFLASSQSSSEQSLDPLVENDHDQQLVNQENIVPDSPIQQNYRMIISYGKELLCILAFILTTFASVQNSTPKVSRAVNPVPFFSKGAFIEDYYFGQLTPTQTKVSLYELSFVLYYAPWCSESQHSRASYEKVARLFNREAYFSAINCWQPGSECRNQYTKIHSWPILMAYQRNGFGIQYQKNLWTEGALTKFVTSLLYPIKRLDGPEDLLELMTTKDALVVAFLDIHTYPRHYKSFYQTALKFLEKDPFNEVGFAVVTGESALSFGVEMIPSIRAYLWNETIEYFGNATWSSRDINKWVNEHLHQVSFNLSPPGTKGSSLTPYLKQGPVLILFTPRNFYSELSDPYVMLQQIGMEYYNCGGDNWVQEMARDYLFERRKENRDRHKTLQKECQEMFQNSFDPEKIKRDCDSSVSLSLANVLNSSKNFEAKFKNVPNFCQMPNEADSCGCEKLRCEKQRRHLKYSYDSNKESSQTSMLDNVDDEYSPISILKYNFRRKCEMQRLAERKDEILFIDDEDSSSLQLVSGLACKANRTFTLIALDSNSFHTFAERLGIDILERENKTAAIIMDQENESTFLLDEQLNLNSLTKFMYTFHRGGLTRFLRTNSIQYKHTHFFDMDEFRTVKNKEKRHSNDAEPKRKCDMGNAKGKGVELVVIREINSEDFEVAVLKSNKTVVVLFFSANCAFCSVMLHSLLSVSRVLEVMPKLEFVRIDGDKNDLAWAFTMAEYPSLVVFPAIAKAESRRYPANLPINIPNVLGFILANLSRSQRLMGLVMACNYKRHNSTNDCINTIQEEISESISYLLGQWRKQPRRRSVYLRLIKHLREFYLRLFSVKSSCDFISFQDDVRRFIGRWQNSERL